ncbi:DUF1266 domain-containing protein, partial [Salmonella enterica]|nr:DUF1266 domain-containing protein [Salmonella enterica]EBD5225827.1 DUF1266 domain-containing protein [Salmonella enterica]MGW96158.1 DUF1266 domain-containing protein [Salmonella enterica]HAC7790871.1 DUF1266 domain-containing protein [Salmonella enterica subsp. enterica serovar Enteritidis]
MFFRLIIYCDLALLYSILVFNCVFICG